MNENKNGFQCAAATYSVCEQNNVAFGQEHYSVAEYRGRVLSIYFNKMLLQIVRLTLNFGDLNYDRKLMQLSYWTEMRSFSRMITWNS